jgi:hypothetical protein
MARPARRDRTTLVEATLTLRLTTEDRELLKKLVELRSAELSVDGIEVTAASYVRGLIRREAAAKGLLHVAPPPSGERTRTNANANANAKTRDSKK